MARTAVPVTSITANALNTTPAGVALDPTNGHTIAAPPAKTERVIVRITQTAGATKTCTFKAGVNPPAPRKGLGDLAVTLAATSGDHVFVLESARFAQADGTINVDLAAAAAGTIAAWAIPKAS